MPRDVGARRRRRRWRCAAASALCAWVAFGVAACSRPGFPDSANIVLITIDTLRADHLSAYGYPRLTSPTLDRLAAEGVRFDQPAVQWPKTAPSFASMFTATYPKNNGIVRKVGVPIPFELRLLAEELGSLGFATHAVVANGAVASDFNFHQGFDTYVETWKLNRLEGAADPSGAEGVTRLALSVAEGIDRERPFFLWVHYVDPHFPYSPPGEWADEFQDDQWFLQSATLDIDRSRPKRDLTGIGFEQVLDEREDLAFYVARYDAEILYTDAHIAQLLEELTQTGLMDRTLTVVTSDHGESLGEHHYYFDHGRFGFQNGLRVPLIFHFPGVLSPRLDPDPVALIDLAPTLLEAAGADLEEGVWMQGTSLSERLFGSAPAPPRQLLAFSEAGYGRRDMWQRIVRDERFKFVDAMEGEAQRWITGGVGKQYALYDLLNDPGETENVLAEYPEDADRLRRLVTRWYLTPFDTQVDTAAGADQAMDDKTREQLKALGYLQ